MLLLECLLAADDDNAVAQVTVPHDGLFLQDGGMPAWVGLEYMAQTVAAWAGWQALQAGRPVQLGFLLGTRKYQATQAFFEPGSCLQVHVHRELMADNGLGMFDCRIRAGEHELAAARISVYEPDEGSEYIQALTKQGAEAGHE